jgi:hypothetical protein
MPAAVTMEATAGPGGPPPTAIPVAAAGWAAATGDTGSGDDADAGGDCR